MLDYPYPCGFIAPLPANPVQAACAALRSDATTPTRALYRAALILVNASGGTPCIDLRAELSRGPARTPAPRGSTSDLGVRAWNYQARGSARLPPLIQSTHHGRAFTRQACTELPLEPITSDGYGFYPPDDGAQTQALAGACRARFGVTPRPAALGVTFGVGADWASAGSNVLFVENDKDPWRVGTHSIPTPSGVNNSVRRHVAVGGAHHQDLRFADARDSPGVRAAREAERVAAARWLAGETS